MDQKLILITLLIRLGVAAAIASAVVRSRYFKSLLFRNEVRSARQQMQIVLFVGVPVALGVWVRAMVPNFSAADVAFESAIIVGVMGGRLAGVALASLCAVPEFFRHEFLAFPLDALAGYVAGAFREYAANREDIWSFSPMVDLSIYRWVRRNFPRPRHDWQVAFFVGILLLQFLREQIGRAFPGRVFFLRGESFWVEVAIYAGTIAAVAIPIKIWNATRIELKLEEQERLLLQTRLDALQSQINPHFLFNTLNSLSSLILSKKTDTAERMLMNLSTFFRATLSADPTADVSLDEEIRLQRLYLDIEQIRFPDRLHVEIDVPDTLQTARVPVLILQPIVENAVKYGVAKSRKPVTVRIRNRVSQRPIRVPKNRDDRRCSQRR